LASPGQDHGGICRLATIAMNSTASAPGFAVVIGLDRSDRKVDLCKFTGSTCEPAWATVSTSPEALRDFFVQLRADFPEGRIGPFPGVSTLELSSSQRAWLTA
jgi:hypothetical protein